MGVLSYDGTSIEFDDSVLAHLHLVIVSKFRRNESLLLSWLDAQTTGGGRTSLWLSTSQPVRFHFDGSRTPVLDRGWLAILQTSADSGTGLVVVDNESRPIRAVARRLF